MLIPVNTTKHNANYGRPSPIIRWSSRHYSSGTEVFPDNTHPLERPQRPRHLYRYLQEQGSLGQRETCVLPWRYDRGRGEVEALEEGFVESAGNQGALRWRTVLRLSSGVHCVGRFVFRNGT